MRRRDLLGLLGSLPLWPLAARAQQSVRVIGFLHGASFTSARAEVSAFLDGVKQAGLAEKQDYTVEYRWAEGHDELLPSLAADLVRRNVAVIVAGGGDRCIAAAQQATASIPIVFVANSDPVRSGFVASLSRPGGNMTGVSVDAPELLAKRFEMLNQIAPRLAGVAVLVNPQNPNFEVQAQYLIDSAKRTGIRIRILNASGDEDFAAALNAIALRQEAGLLVANDGFLNNQRGRLVALAARCAVPAAFSNREFVEAGGLMSYGPSLVEAYRQAGIYAGHILKGEKFADFPVVHPVEFELAINRKTAASLDIKIPPALLAAANAVIE